MPRPPDWRTAFRARFGFDPTPQAIAYEQFLADLVRDLQQLVTHLTTHQPARPAPPSLRPRRRRAQHR